MAFDKTLPFNELPGLPPPVELDTVAIYKQLADASWHLGQLNGLCSSLPDPSLLINTVILQESKDSSAIENIITTQDELYKASTEEITTHHAAKEVLSYRAALYAGLQKMQAQHNLLLTNTFIEIVRTIKQNQSGIRNTPGTVLKNAFTGEVIFTPPTGEAVIREKLKALEEFINNSDKVRLHPLIKMALLHYQFEAIHPFADGNGRTGRILNSLYLVQQDLLSQPVLYLSAYIVQHKAEYYQKLRGVTEKNEWQEWILFMLTAISQTAQLTTKKIREMLSLKQELEPRARQLLGSSFKYDLFQLLFTLPYLKIDIIDKKGIAHRQTAAGWMKKLVEGDLLHAQKLGKTT
ncbi:MAG TPA: Fic family protein, partial [Chitinophaga sp.]